MREKEPLEDWTQWDEEEEGLLVRLKKLQETRPSGFLPLTINNWLEEFDCVVADFESYTQQLQDRSNKVREELGKIEHKLEKIDAKENPLEYSCYSELVCAYNGFIQGISEVLGVLKDEGKEEVSLGWWLCKDWNTLMLAGDDVNVIFHIEYKNKHIYYRLFFSYGVHYLILIQDEEEDYPTYVALDSKDQVVMFCQPHSGVVPIRDILYDSELDNILQNEWNRILKLFKQTK